MGKQEYITVEPDTDDVMVYRLLHMGFTLPILGRGILIEDTSSVVCLPQKPKTVPYGALLGVDIETTNDRLVGAQNWFFGTVSNEQLGVTPGSEIDIHDESVLESLLYSLNSSSNKLGSALNQLFEMCPYD